MSNWALELQGFDIIRVWIRGEANILADAPSRAPWDNELARNMPIPDMPVRELVNMMYKAPEELELLGKGRRLFSNAHHVDDLGIELGIALQSLSEGNPCGFIVS